MFYRNLVLTLILSTSWAQLPPKVIKMKESLSKELQSIPEAVAKHHPNHTVQLEKSTRVHLMFNEFIEQNQQGLDAVLRVLKLIDHDLENVIQDCVRIFDIEALQSTNRIFVNVTKPLLDQVERLCQIVTENRIDELEASLEQVERTAASYREKLDQTLQNIAIILSNVDDESFFTRMKSKEVDALDHLNSLNSSLLEPVETNFKNFLTKSISDYRNFTLAISVDFSEEQPEILNLLDFLDFVDNETSILQGELQEFLESWFFMIEEVITSINLGTQDINEDMKETLLNDLLAGVTELKCAASYIQFFEPVTTDMFNGFYQCIEYEEEMTKAYQQVSSVLESTDKAIKFLLESYFKCARIIKQFPEVTFNSCLRRVDELLEQTEEYIEHKINEIYFHVEDALIFNGVMIEACLGQKLRDSALNVSQLIKQYADCNQADADGPALLYIFDIM